MFSFRVRENIPEKVSILTIVVDRTLIIYDLAIHMRQAMRESERDGAVLLSLLMNVVTALKGGQWYRKSMNPKSFINHEGHSVQSITKNTDFEWQCLLCYFVDFDKICMT